MVAAEKPGLVAREVFVTYRNGQTALKNATFEVPTSTITGLVGVNGAGKSTLFKAIMGFIPLAKGEISVFGLPVKAALKQNIVAYVPQAEEVD
ncbi:MAG: ATP-binding cassette domain-containing protein, partial [Notoacmeibacter sp.]